MSSESDSSYVEEKWSSWFCSLHGNNFFCEVEKSYIEDTFNLFGLKQYLGTEYNRAMDTILDKLSANEPETEELSRSAALLYGMIHARFIITPRGLDCMQRKYELKHFGECPRMLCKGQDVIPMGVADDPKHGMVKLFCPKCRDVYNCQPDQRHIDGAFFGPTFPNLFFMAHEGKVPHAAVEQFIPRLFGFRVHSSSKSVAKPSAEALELLARTKTRAGAGTGLGRKRVANSVEGFTTHTGASASATTTATNTSTSAATSTSATNNVTAGEGAAAAVGTKRAAATASSASASSKKLKQ